MDDGLLFSVQDVPSQADEDVLVRGVREGIESMGACISVSSSCLALAAYSCCRAVLAVSSRHSLISAMMRASSYYDKQVPTPPVNSGKDPIARHKLRFHIDRLPTGVELHQGPIPLVAGPSSHTTFWEDTLARYECRLLLDRMPNGVELCRDFKIPSQGHRTPQVSGHARDNHTGGTIKKSCHHAANDHDGSRNA
jgi:hypothetical protein